MAGRALDRLLPAALALVAGTVAAAAGIAALAADVFIGRPSSSSGVAAILLLPIVLLAAVVGFAAGHGLGGWLRRRGLSPAVRMGPYRVVMTVVLGIATVMGATFGARPVIRHERLLQPRVLTGADAVERHAAGADECPGARPAPVACDALNGVTAYALVWNGRETTLGCTREGHLTVSDAAGGVTASVDLTGYEYVREVRAAVARQRDGRESLALLAGLHATGGRDMFVIVDADGRVIYQELLERASREAAAPLAVCPADDRDAIAVDTGTPLIYRTK